MSEENGNIDGATQPLFDIGDWVLYEDDVPSQRIEERCWSPRVRTWIYGLLTKSGITKCSEFHLTMYNPVVSASRKAQRRPAPEETTTVAPTPDDLIAQAIMAEKTAAHLRRRAGKLAAAAEAARRPEEPPLGGVGDRAIVSFSRYQSGRVYNYAAIGWVAAHVDNVSAPPAGHKITRWAVTGMETRRMNWTGLLEFIGAANWPTLHLMTEDRLLGPLPGEEGPVAEVMGNYGRVLHTETVRHYTD